MAGNAQAFNTHPPTNGGLKLRRFKGVDILRDASLGLNWQTRSYRVRRILGA
jgi:hypothetical protein